MGSLPALIFMLVVADRTGSQIQVAHEAAAVRDLERARQAADLAWIYLSPVFETAWRAHGKEREELRYRLVQAEAMIELARERPGVEQLSNEVETRLQAETAAKRASVAKLDAIIADAKRCWDKANSLAADDLVATCRSTHDRAVSAREAAAEAARLRDLELRRVLTGDRLALYEEYGEPVGELASDDAAAIARAPTWVFVVGPTGALKSYEKLVVTFKANKIVSKKRTTFKEAP